jgi:hypothetical protein
VPIQVGKRSRTDFDSNESNDLRTNTGSTKRLRPLSNRALFTFDTEQESLQLGTKRKLADDADNEPAASNVSSARNLAQPAFDLSDNSTSPWIKRLRANSTFMGYDKSKEQQKHDNSTQYLLHGSNTRILSMDTWEPLPPLDNDKLGPLKQTEDMSSSSSLTLVPWSGKVLPSPRLPDKIILPNSSDNWWRSKSNLSPLSMRYWPSSNSLNEEEGNDDNSKNAMILYRPDAYYSTTAHDDNDNYYGPIIEELPSEDGGIGEAESNENNTCEEQNQVVEMSLD